jgi:hypothetical protein
MSCHASLYSGKISPNDLTVNTEFEVASTWSRRVHTLERIADKVGVTNEYCAYSAFITKPHLRYLFQTYSGVRGSTLFLSKDRLFLTKSILDSFFDMDILKEEGVVSDFMAMHDANRGDKLTLGGRSNTTCSAVQCYSVRCDVIRFDLMK